MTGELAGAFDHIEALSFDCYGTLIDWERGIAAALGRWAERYGLDASPDELVALFSETETDVQAQGPTMLYPDVLAETLRQIGRRVGTDVDELDAARFGASVGDWPAFPDSAAALARLATRYRLIVLSNVDRVSFSRSAARLQREFDLIITAEDVGAYKPARPHFEKLLSSLGNLGMTQAALLHVAQSIYHDHEPARQFGIASVWIDRRSGRAGWGATPAPRQAGAPPHWRYPSMAAFAEAAVPTVE